MTDLTGRYLCSEQTLAKAQSYLESLARNEIKPGARLAEVLSEVNLEDINAKQLIALLMNTRKPRIFAESEPHLDGSDWNSKETAILGDVVFSTTGTHAFNNGAHNENQQDHDTPLETNFLFVASALLKNGYSNQTSDMTEVLSNKNVDEEAFYKLYERRLLPGLLVQNELARQDKKPLVINIPGLGCGQFAGNHEAKIRAALPRVLKRIFETHAAKLDMVHTVNYDPYKPLAKDEFTTDKLKNSKIRLLARPLLALPEEAQSSQLEFPKDGTDYTGCRLIKIVAWDHFSFPGNDIWANIRPHGNGRATDDGVSFASSDAIIALFALGQFKSSSPVVSTDYCAKQGIVYAINPENNLPVGYQELASIYPSKVTTEMIDVVPLLIVELNKNSEEINLEMVELKQKEIAAVFEIKLEKEEAEKIDPRIDFDAKKQAIKTLFNNKLLELDSKLDKLTTKDQYISTYNSLRSIQDTLLDNITPEFTEEQLKKRVSDFRDAYKRHIKTADEIMGHGWLYRTAEVVIKAIVGLFAGIGMVLGSIIGQGLANPEHRQKFANTFFRLEQTAESEVLAQYAQDLLGNDEDNEGLLCLQNLTFA